MHFCSSIAWNAYQVSIYFLHLYEHFELKAWVKCNIDEDLIVTTAKLMKSLGLQVNLCVLGTRYDGSH